MEADDIFDLCIVGAGLIGSATAQHASDFGRVCLVGPAEPKSRDLKDNRDIYGAHYDEGRITRCSDRDPVWAELTQKSIGRYRQLEKRTGILFFEEVGSIVSGERNSTELISTENVITAQSLETERLSYQEFKVKFPYLNISPKDYAIFESKKSGYISPRRLVAAQIKQARTLGCTYIPEVVNSVSRIVKNGGYCMRISTSEKEIWAKKVLLATGAFTSFRNLLPTGIQLDVGLCPITVTKVEISESDFRKIRTMPSMVYFGNGAHDWTTKFPRTVNGLVYWYLLPPVKYPNGKYYIKLGHFHNISSYRLTTNREVQEWFCSGGDKPIIDATAELITNIVKGVKPMSYHGDCCVITETPTKRPYIDKIHSQLGVAVGGNGYGAKSSDEIGRIAASMMMTDRWDSSLSKELFEVKYKKSTSKI